jgi:hypothetical protein
MSVDPYAFDPPQLPACIPRAEAPTREQMRVAEVDAPRHLREIGARLAELEAKLPCLTGHHEPLMVVGADGALAPFVIRVQMDCVPLQRFCKTCRLSYWHEIVLARLEIG